MTGPLVIFGQIVMFLYIPLIWVVDGAQNKSGEVAVNHETALQCMRAVANYDKMSLRQLLEYNVRPHIGFQS